MNVSTTIIPMGACNVVRVLMQTGEDEEVSMTQDAAEKLGCKLIAAARLACMGFEMEVRDQS